MSWWTELYDDRLSEWMLHNSPAGAAERTRHFLQTEAGLGAGTRVLDQGCGPGRLVAELARAGAKLQGIDLIPSYVESARRRAVVDGLDPSGFRVGDIGALTSNGPVDLVFSWWTCLGYAPDDETNALPLQRAFESLIPGGFYAIDTLHTPGVLRGFVPVMTSQTPMADGVAHLTRTSRLDVEAGVLHKHWHWRFATGEQQDVHSQVRLYMPHEWVRMLRDAGFERPRCFGDLDSSPLGPDSPRLLLVARKPE